MRSLLARPLSLTCLLGCLAACGASAKEKRQETTVVTRTVRTAPAAPAPKSSPPPNAFARDMLETHNQARATARPVPKPPLPPLQWSAEAAKQAESWAKQCTFEHNPDRGPYGENLAAATPGAWKTPEVVKSWNAEVADYNFSRNTCAKGKMCGHYTQVVWRNTTHVGCAKRTCTKNSPFGKDFPTWDLWVCNYAPPGNVVGQKPY
ncbi:CAP domain-containing protein [Stigmatella erecta]|uniref:Cysteine-rich secretory protein family protein n=1 Tax=Stigmatella erecta TaxID=83460 RepID=A0A1I0L206_9BACT|nr:CAP domain-containing protein [Stigmatella erecta]SEU33176.1 Cysteine-rich secretory protein family protein [Stigmatella erecta]